MAKKNGVAALVKSTSSDYPSAVPYRQSAEDKARERRYKAEDALRCLTRATEVQRDKALMRDVKALAQQQMKELSAVTKTRKPSGR